MFTDDLFVVIIYPASGLVGKIDESVLHNRPVISGYDVVLPWEIDRVEFLGAETLNASGTLYALASGYPNKFFHLLP